jgi:hypothetical protein
MEVDHHVNFCLAGVHLLSIVFRLQRLVNIGVWSVGHEGQEGRH